jgi:hypothetical protein
VSIKDIYKKARKERRRLTAYLLIALVAALAVLFGVFVLAPALVGAAPTAQATVQEVPALDWDSRLDELNVTHTPAADCSSGCWVLVSARYESPEESGGLHHLWARALDEQGQQLAGQPWTVAWPEGSAVLQTKAAGEWADFPMYASYDPFERDETGPYRAFAGTDEARSDTVQGMGLPLKHHVSFRMVWQWQPAGAALPTPTPSPTVSPEPIPELPLRWYLPVGIK